MEDLEGNSSSPDTAVMSFLSRQVLSFPQLLSADDFDKAVITSLKKLPLEYQKEWQTIQKKDYSAIEKWLSVFKNYYHEQIAGMLINKELEDSIQSSLAELNTTCKDYMTWYYEDAFSFDQISTITGQSLQIVISKLQSCRIEWQAAFSAKNISYPVAMPDEERFRQLADYFENKIHSSEAAEHVRLLSDSNAEMQRHDALELWLRQPKNKLYKKYNTNDMNVYLSAEEFLRLAKENIQQQNNRNVP